MHVLGLSSSFYMQLANKLSIITFENNGLWGTFPLPCVAFYRQGMGVTGGVPFGFNVGVKDGQAGGTLSGIDLVRRPF